ncbi:MAG: sugar phosphate isomerase/epimerase family protein [Egibacteraceae bacterium]
MEHPTPRLLVSTGPLLLSPLDWVLDTIADAGYDGAELLFAHNPETRDADRVRTLAERAGLTIPVVHGPYMVLLRNVLGSRYEDKTRRSLELAAAMGAESMVAHAPFRWERRARGWLATEVDHEATEIGAAFAMENLFPVGGRAFSSVVTPDEMAPFRHLVFDTSHFGVADVDLFAAWDVLGGQVVHLHVSDNFGNGKDSHAPIGTGVLPLERFLGQVGAGGYTGTITLELDCRAYMDSRESLVGFLSRERRKAQALLAGQPFSGAPAPASG